jgi:hypothetical protein
MSGLTVTGLARDYCTYKEMDCSRWFLGRGFFYSEDGGDTFLRNIGSHKIYTASHHRRRHSS